MYTAKEASLLSPGLLAYIGDSVFEVMVREHLLKKGFRKLQEIHQKTVAIVNATSQAKLVALLEDCLSPAEKDIVRRGRNSQTGKIPDNVDMIDYRWSTGFEALIGFLYLSDQRERLAEIWDNIIRAIEEREKEK
ncbi:MAG TPA: ribonuclease III [Halanaerobiaceae bacterium]|jgi:ribonuclease-3 family protein|nr:ribonuclease III [Halanaerobiaceae bacterium]